MKIPQLRKKPEIKSCHNVTWEDNYSWIHQENILEVLKDSSKLLPEVKKYLEEEIVKNRDYSVSHKDDIIKYASNFDWVNVIKDRYIPCVEDLISKI